MTSGSSDAVAVGPDQGGGAADLSSAFGASAASSLRGVHPRRASGGREVAEPTPDADEPAAGVRADSLEPDPVEETEPVEDDPQDSRSPRPPSAARHARSARIAAPTRTVTRRRAKAPAPGRHFGVVRVRDRRNVDLLLLAVAGTGPANGREFIELVRERSDGVFILSERAVYHELHRLKNDRLIRITWSGGARRYLLTTLGERVLTTRRRRWEAFSHGFDKVLEAAADGS